MALLLAIVTLLVMGGISVAANRHFHAYDRLPMQFGLSGEVGWTAPRAVALSFTPALVALILIPTALVPDAIWGVVFGGAISVLAHLFYLWLVSRHLRG